MLCWQDGGVNGLPNIKIISPPLGAVTAWSWTNSAAKPKSSETLNSESLFNKNGWLLHVCVCSPCIVRAIKTQWDQELIKTWNVYLANRWRNKTALTQFFLTADHLIHTATSPWPRHTSTHSPQRLLPPPSCWGPQGIRKSFIKQVAPQHWPGLIKSWNRQSASQSLAISPKTAANEHQDLCLSRWTDGFGISQQNPRYNIASFLFHQAAMSHRPRSITTEWLNYFL